MNLNDGTFRTRKNGTIEYRVYVDGNQKSFYGKNENECKRKARMFAQQYQQEKILQEQKKFHITLQDYAINWLTTYKFNSVANSTYDRLESVYNVHIKDSIIGKKEMPLIHSDDIQKFINEKLLTMTLSSIKKIREVLVPCFSKAYHDNIISSNPMETVVFPRNDKALPIKNKIVECYTNEEVAKIVQTSLPIYFSKYAKRYRYAPMFVFILNTGLRIGECLALTWKDVDLDNKMITVFKSITTVYNRGRFNTDSHKVQIIGCPKTDAGKRFIPLNDAAIEALLEMRKRNFMLNIHSNQDLIFSNYDGNLLSIRSVQGTFKKICEDFDIHYQGLHALRHTFGSVLIQKKVDIKIVSELLGHTDVKFTYNRYIHIINSQKVEAIKLLNITEPVNKIDNDLPSVV